MYLQIKVSLSIADNDIDMFLTTLPGRMNAVLRGSAQWKKGENPEIGRREIRVLVTPTPDADASQLVWCQKYIQSTFSRYFKCILWI